MMCSDSREHAKRRWAQGVLGLPAKKRLLEIVLAKPVQRLPDPSFEVRDAEDPKRKPHFNTLEVVDASGVVVWRAKAKVFGVKNGAARITYGESLSGYVDEIGPAPLRPKAEYVLMLVGAPVGKLRFTVQSDKTITAA